MSSVDYGMDDLEDLESRLYSQVHYGSNENTETVVNVEVNLQSGRKTNRYFDKDKAPTNQHSLASFIPLETEPTSNQTRNVQADQSFYNNITVNQYNIPALPYVKNTCGTWISKTALKKQRRKNKKKLLKKATKAEQIKRKPKDIEVICLSDKSDTEDCIIINGNPEWKNETKKIDTKFPKKYDDKIHLQKPESDEDIIYIPPPPIPVINVDVDMEEAGDQKDHKDKNQDDDTLKQTEVTDLKGKETYHSSERNELLHTPESNDFLENLNVEHSQNDFNFGLHGSDLNISHSDLNGGNGSFVRPANPVDFCETESSCSTNDLNRDFNNSVKTVVFNEVDFPKDDIFTETDLESFGTFITPKRKEHSTKRTKNVESVAANISNKNKTDTIAETLSDSDGSSSESDYESSVAHNKNKLVSNLPNLSPMAHPIRETKLSQKKIANKRKSDVVESTNSDSELDNSKTGNLKKKNKKKKNKDLDKSGKDTAFKKKKKAALEAEDTNQSSPVSVEDKPKKKKKKTNSESKASNELEKNTDKKSNLEVKNKTIETSKTSIALKEYSQEVTEDNHNLNASETDLNKAKTDLGQDQSFPKNFITVDEVQNESQSQAVDSSDSDFDFRDLNVGNNLQLANLQGPTIKEITNETNDKKPEQFDVNLIHSRQTDNPQAWKILDIDKRGNLDLYNDKSKGPRCRRCRQFGHVAGKCKEKPKVGANCVLCGKSGHLEHRCPDIMCMQCGNKGGYSTDYCYICFKFRHLVCTLCKMTGHIAKFCPDLWRRYHMTTKDTHIVASKSNLKPVDQRWCSGCSKRGHFEHECSYYNRQYPPTNPLIVNYEDNLSDKKKNTRENKNTRSNYSPKSRKKSLESKPSNCTITTNELTTQQNHPQNAVTFATNNYGPNLLPQPTNPMVSYGHYLPITQQPIQEQQLALIRLLLNIPNQQNNLVPQAPIASGFNPQEQQSNSQQFHLNSYNEINRVYQKMIFNDNESSRNIIMNMQPNIVRDFIAKEMFELDTSIRKHSPKLLQAKLVRYDHLPRKSVSPNFLQEKLHYFKILNQFVFGVNKMGNGYIHYNNLKRFLIGPPLLNIYRRRSLWSAYNYIFGAAKHTDISYFQTLRSIANGDKFKK